jgi:hypothetical protein
MLYSPSSILSCNEKGIIFFQHVFRLWAVSLYDLYVYTRASTRGENSSRLCMSQGSQ